MILQQQQKGQNTPNDINKHEKGWELLLAYTLLFRSALTSHTSQIHLQSSKHIQEVRRLIYSRASQRWLHSLHLYESCSLRDERLPYVLWVSFNLIIGGIHNLGLCVLTRYPASLGDTLQPFIHGQLELLS